MNVTVSPAKLTEALNSDGEFRLQARFWDGVLQLEFGTAEASRLTLRLEGGEVVDPQAAPVVDGTKCSVIIAAPVADWYEFLQPLPKPLYHELFPASFRKGFELKGDEDYVWAYYAALRRVGEILRHIATIEEA